MKSIQQFLDEERALRQEIIKYKFRHWESTLKWVEMDLKILLNQKHAFRQIKNTQLYEKLDNNDISRRDS